MYHWLVEARREVCCFSACPEAPFAIPVRDTRWGQVDQSDLDSRSGLVVLTLTVLGKILAVPKHPLARE